MHRFQPLALVALLLLAGAALSAGTPAHAAGTGPGTGPIQSPVRVMIAQTGQNLTVSPNPVRSSRGQPVQFQNNTALTARIIVAGTALTVPSHASATRAFTSKGEFTFTVTAGKASRTAILMVVDPTP